MENMRGGNMGGSTLLPLNYEPNWQMLKDDHHPIWKCTIFKKVTQEKQTVGSRGKKQQVRQTSPHTSRHQTISFQVLSFKNSNYAQAQTNMYSQDKTQRPRQEFIPPQSAHTHARAHPQTPGTYAKQGRVKMLCT